MFWSCAFSYTYDAGGRQATKSDSFGTTSYSYDAAGRVTQVAMPGKTTLYAYDKAGNRQSLSETYSQNNQADTSILRVASR